MSRSNHSHRKPWNEEGREYVIWQFVVGPALIVVALVLSCNAFLLSNQLQPVTETGHDRRDSAEYYPLLREVRKNVIACGAFFLLGIVFLVWGFVA